MTHCYKIHEAEPGGVVGTKPGVSDKVALWGTWLGLASFQPFQEAALLVCVRQLLDVPPSPSLPPQPLSCTHFVTDIWVCPMGQQQLHQSLVPVFRGPEKWGSASGILEEKQMIQSKGQSQWMQEGRPAPSSGLLPHCTTWLLMAPVPWERSCWAMS